MRRFRSGISEKCILPVYRLILAVAHRMFSRVKWWCIIVLMASACEAQRVVLSPFAEISNRAVREPSGIVKSRTYDNVYWIHPDSGQPGNIFAIRMDGEVVMPEQTDGVYTGIYIQGAVNFDWEDIALDDDGYLYIGDVGDNLLFRPFLSVYQIKEPDPTRTVSVPVIKRMDMRFPEGTAERNVEAMIHAGGHLHILSKHRVGGYTTMFRHEVGTKQLVRLGRINVKGQVTAADYDEVNNRLAVLTYGSIWIFRGIDELGKKGASWRPYTGPASAEAITFQGSDLLILDENLKLYHVESSSLLEVE